VPLFWIIPPFLGSLVLLGVYGYLTRAYREPFLRLWTWGWLLYTARFGAMVPIALGAPRAPWQVANQLCALWSGYLLLRGARVFADKRLAGGWALTAAALSAWVVAGPLWEATFVVYTAPTFLFLGFANLEAGRVLLASGKQFPRAGAAVRFTGAVFVLWGLHKWDYPFLARLPAAAPWGYTLGAAFSLVTAVGLLIAYLEREHDRAEQARRFLRTVLDTVPDRVLVVDPQLRVIQGNRAAGFDVNGPEGAVSCRDLHENIGVPCRAGERACPVADAMETGATVRVVRDLSAPGGSVRTLEVLVAPLKTQDGKLLGAVTVGRDITERAQLLASLAQAKAEWEATFDAVPDLLAVVGPDLRIRRVNRPLARRLGRSPAEVVGLGMEEAGLAEMGRAASRGGEGELRSSRLGGVFLVSATPVSLGARDSDRGWVYVARDITRQKRAEDRLAQERANLDTLLGTMSDAVIAVDAHGCVTFLNAAAEGLTGWPAARARGRPLEEVIPPCEGFSLAEAVRAVLAGGNPWAGEGCVQPRGGGRREVDAQVLALRPEHPSGSGAVIVMRDVTDARALERERVRSEHVEALGVFAGGLAHDFNNLLMGISGNLELAERRLRTSPERALEPLRRAQDACRRASGVARQLLTFARGGEPVRKRVDLGPLLEGWVRFPLAGSSVTAEIHVAPDLKPVDVDVEQIHQVITNLVVNARQAMPEGGRLRVWAENADTAPGAVEPRRIPSGYVRITVADEGCGIPPEHLPRIFDPYFTTKQDGTGLGLATSYSVVRRHGGTIQVESQEGAGATFCVYLPTAPSARPGEGAAEGLPPEEAVPGLRILAMDDDPLLREILQENLESCGARPYVVEDGEQAVAAFRTAKEEGRPYQAVVLDLTVRGGMGGLEAARRIRELDPAVPIVAASGYAEAPAIARPRECGFDAAVSKPYSFAELCRVLAPLVRAAAT